MLSTLKDILRLQRKMITARRQEYEKKIISAEMIQTKTINMVYEKKCYLDGLYEGLRAIKLIEADAERCYINYLEKIADK